MTDRLSPDRRSWLMSRIRSKDTSPEMAVRRALHAMGFRFRLHRRDLPGRPDIVLPRHRLAIFVHGCFWHRHPGCRLSSTPKTRTDFWQAKFDRNVERDRQALADLAAAGWRTLVIWECQTRLPRNVETALKPAKPAAGLLRSVFDGTLPIAEGGTNGRA